jgi:predicted glycoside hydrolase/deacetylase ChbG (UPF0249 family)
MILFINADDFGMSTGVNHGIIQAHQAGVVTSASMMVRGAAVTEAAALACENPLLGVGLHVDLCEWECRNEEWHLRYCVVPMENAETVAQEVGRQLCAFRALMGRDPTHIDSHQHVHRDDPVRTVLQGVARKLGIPLRHFHADISYEGTFYGQSHKGDAFIEAISVESLLDIIRTLPADATELACHPAAAPDMDSTYKEERIVELKSLCDPRVRAAITKSGVELRSFRDFALDSGRYLSLATETQPTPKEEKTPMFTRRHHDQGWEGGIRDDDAAALRQIVQDHNIKSLLEFGPGYSTHVFLCAGVERIVSFEYDPSWFETARKLFANDKRVTILPYANTSFVVVNLEGQTFDAAFVDSPQGNAKARVVHREQEDVSRYNTLRAALIHAPLAFLHDARRPLEQATLARLVAEGLAEWDMFETTKGIAQLRRLKVVE